MNRFKRYRGSGNSRKFKLAIGGAIAKRIDELRSQATVAKILCMDRQLVHYTESMALYKIYMAIREVKQ